MSFAQVFGNWPKWFHIFGQCSSLPRPSDQLLSSSSINYFQRVTELKPLKYVPAITLAILALALSIVASILSSFFVNFWVITSFSTVLTVLNAVILSSFSLIVLFTAAQTLCQPNDFRQLYAVIAFIEELARGKLTLELNRLRSFLIKRMVYVCIGHTFSYLQTPVLQPMTATTTELWFTMLIMRILILITYFHNPHTIPHRVTRLYVEQSCETIRKSSEC